jgi:hypothetical protein
VSAFDEQIGGNHYKQMMIQPLEYALENNLGICEHAVVKYISRWKAKGGVDDLRKCIHYCQILIEREIGTKTAPKDAPEGPQKWLHQNGADNITE